MQPSKPWGSLWALSSESWSYLVALGHMEAVRNRRWRPAGPEPCVGNASRRGRRRGWPARRAERRWPRTCAPFPISVGRNSKPVLNPVKPDRTSREVNQEVSIGARQTTIRKLKLALKKMTSDVTNRETQTSIDCWQWNLVITHHFSVKVNSTAS